MEGIQKALKSINKALAMANNSLLSLKIKEESELQNVDLAEVVETAVELSKVYLLDKNIDLQIEKEDSAIALADVEKLTAVIINLVKNASEAFEEVHENGKYIKIKVDKTENYSAILVSNNAKGIENPDKIFNEGFTTKSSGSGLGLWICKKSIEEQNGELELTRSTEDYTEFTIKLGKGE
jgi:signal transduction histidine kinase